MTQIRTFLIRGEAATGSEARVVLQQIGAALDQHRSLLVYIRGRVAVDHASVASPSKENGYERQGERGSPARSWQRSTRRKGPSRRSRSAGTPARISSDVLRAGYELQLKQLVHAYPTCRAVPDKDGMWLLTRSSILSGLEREATFVTAVPFQPGAPPRAWGFWTADGESSWIGPRHTNFHDGSICAFSPQEGAWSEGGDLTRLLDLYSVWAVRHLYLEVFGRWPGKQYSLGTDPRVQAFYRMRECHDDELCGCGSETRRYSECCKPWDLKVDFVDAAGAFLQAAPGGFQTRVPPPSIVAYIEDRSGLPEIAELPPPSAQRS